jgi:hypothetical protein
MISKLLLAVIAGIFLSACSTLPIKKGPDECLVVVKYEVLNKSMLPIGSLNWFDFSSDYPSAMLPRDGGVVAFVIKEPAVQIVSITNTPANGFKGETTNFKISDIYLPYTPGHIAVADFVFFLKIVDTGHGESSSFGFRWLTDSERQDLLNELIKKKSGDWVP